MYSYCDMENILYKDGKVYKKDYEFSLDDFDILFGIVEGMIPSGATVLTSLKKLGLEPSYGKFMIGVYEVGTNYLDRLIKSESIRGQRFIDDLIGLTARLEGASKDELVGLNAKISAIKYMLSVSGSDRFDKVRGSGGEGVDGGLGEFRLVYFGNEDIKDGDKAGLGGSDKILQYFRKDWENDYNSPMRSELKESDKDDLKESFDKSS